MAGYIEVHTGSRENPRRVTLNIFNTLTITEGANGAAVVASANDPIFGLAIHESYDEVKRLINVCGYPVVGSEMGRS